MARFEPRLIATDLDGTLLRSDLSISGRTRAALRTAQAAGVPTVFVSARPPRAILEFAAHVGLVGLAVCSNGAILYDIATDQILHRHDLSDAHSIAARLRSTEPNVILGVEYGHDVACEPGFPADGAFKEVRDDRIFTGPALFNEALVKIVAHHPHHDPHVLHDRVAAGLGDGVSVTRSGGPFIEIAAAGVSKSAGLARLCERLGVEATDVAAFGDMPNDVPMLSWAGLGVAVANAHPDALAAADEVTASNDDDGVAVVVERLFAQD